jgi:tRNA A-37 threonylcarbamoyl transferase component Bud32
MSLAPGDRLAQYEILGPLGAGGMGEVHRAKDTRLQREVAIKVLADSLAADEDRLRRFQREARILASLNHPHVAQIYEVDQAGGRSYLVLELVPGENLAERIARGPLPVEEALDLCRQVAEALEAAHEAGVIHRDLKPANVRVTPEGSVKVLDFGLAKPLAPLQAAGHASSAVEDSFLMSQEGLVLGTPCYMSPEQVRGRPLDRRTDIWAFGCLLHECLTGRRLFGGESVGDLMAAVLKGEPDWSRLPASTPSRVRELLARCLVKEPRQRLRDVGDARLWLEEAVAGREAITAAAAARPGRRALLGGVALLLAVAVAGYWLGGGSARTPAADRVFHLALPFSREARFLGLVAIAPDASYIVYRSSAERRTDLGMLSAFLVTRRLDREEELRIDGTEGAASAALSADGRWLAFLAAKDPGSHELALKRVALEDGRQTGPPTTVCDKLPGWATLCFASDQELVLAMGVPAAKILAVPAQGGELRVVAEPPDDDKGVRGWWQPRPLPGGETVDLATGVRRTALEKASGAYYVPTGHLLALRDQALVAPRACGRGTEVPRRRAARSGQRLPEPLRVHAAAGHRRGRRRVRRHGAGRASAGDARPGRGAALRAAARARLAGEVPRRVRRGGPAPEGVRPFDLRMGANATKLVEEWRHGARRALPGVQLVQRHRPWWARWMWRSGRDREVG